MITHLDKPFRLGDGLDRYNPAVTSDQVKFFTLDNLEPLLGRLVSSRGYHEFQDLVLTSGEQVVSYGFYQLENRRFSNLYAFTNTSVYWYNFETNSFEATPIYTGFGSSTAPFVLLPWYGALYVTRQNAPIVKIERKVVTAVAGAPAARYGIVANSHAYLASINAGVSTRLARVQWSDLDDLESWVINPASSEADFFDLEADSMEVTGVSYQRGSPIVYTQNTIWFAFWIGFPGGFRHEPLFTGIGNIFHNSVVRNKEIDFFIGQDNFYALNGRQLSPIGSEIFEKFIAEVQISADTSVPGFLDSRRNQVFWVYTKTDGSRWSVVYNYLEKKWSERDPQGLTTFFDTPRVALRGHDVINNLSSTIDSLSGYIDDLSSGTARALPPLVGGQAVPVSTVSTDLTKVDGGQFASKLETFDFFYDHFATVKEMIRAEVEYVGAGSPNLTIRIGTRKNQSADISWSSPIPVSVFDGTFSFFFRSEAVGKYLRFRFEWKNSAENYISELLMLSFTKVEYTPDDNPTK